jgi:hypothetical protein
MILPMPKNESAERLLIFALQLFFVIYYLVYLSGKTILGPTLDDSWIHYQYARNLAVFGEISFNQGVWSTGTTSLLWTLILAGGIYIGLPVVEFSLALGIALYLILGQQLYGIFRAYWNGNKNYLLSLFVVLLTGNIIWYSLSGMETLLFLVLGLWWINCFRREKYLIAGLIAGFLAITRLEGMLFLIMGLFFAFKKHSFVKGIKAGIMQIVCAIPVLIPSLILNMAVTGRLYPNTLAGKKWLYGLSSGFINLSPHDLQRFVLSWVVTFVQTDWLPWLFDRPTTLQYPIIKLLTGGRVIKTMPNFELPAYPLWLQAGALMVAFGLLIVLLYGMFKVVLPALKNLLVKREFQSWEYLVFWFLAQNLIYAILMPLRGHGGRYQAVNFLLVGLFLVAGVEMWKSVARFWLRLRKYALKIIIIIIYLTGAFIWADIYADSVKLVNDVHRSSGEWMRDNLPPGTVIAVFDVGAIKYFSGLPVVDIAGLTDNEALKYVLAGNILPYMKEHNAEYFAIVEEYPPKGKFSSNEYPLYESNIYDKLGLRREVGKSIDLIPVKRFSVPMELWWRPWVTVRTHSPIIMVYRIVWLHPPLLAMVKG